MNSAMPVLAIAILNFWESKCNCEEIYKVILTILISRFQQWTNFCSSVTQCQRLLTASIVCSAINTTRYSFFYLIWSHSFIHWICSHSFTIHWICSHSFTVYWICSHSFTVYWICSHSFTIHWICSHSFGSYFERD